MGGSDDNIAEATPEPDLPPPPSVGAPFVAPTAADLNERLPPFEVIELLGQGGMGAVYKARQPRLDRFVAIKLLPTRHDADGANFAERFEREARAMAQMNHPNIVTVHDFGETVDGLRYIVMEYVHGTDLHSAISSGELTLKHALAWIPQICSALEYAHDHDVIHRDIKPANILISEEGQVKVGDFGLAKLVGRKRETAITQTKVSMGTPDYAAPEALLEGADVDSRADIYSLGVLFYELLTGRVPRGAWRPPSAFCDADVRFDQIIVKAMQPDPEHRYQQVSQVTQALQKLKNAPKLVAPQGNMANKAGGSIPPSQVSVHGPRQESLHPLIVVGIVLGAIFLILGLSLLVVSQQPEKPPLAGSPETDPPPRPPIIETPVSPDKEPKDPVGAMVRGAEDEGEKDPERMPKVRPERPPAPVAPREGDDWVKLAPARGLVPKALGQGWEETSEGLVYAPTVVAGELVRRGRAIFQPPVPPAYEVSFTLEPAARSGPLEVHLPTGKDPLTLVLGAEGPGRGLRMAGLAGIGHQQVAHPDNPTGWSLKLDPRQQYEVLIRVVGNGAKRGLEALVNGEVVTWWKGDPAQRVAPPLNRPVKGSGLQLLALTAGGPLKVSGLRLKALSADAGLNHPRPPRPERSPMDLLTRPGPEPKSPGNDMALSPVRERLQEIRSKFEIQEAELARAGYDRKLSELQESYQAALNRVLTAESSLPLEAAVQRELNRIRDQEPIESEDPPEMPEQVKTLRGIYRTEVKELDEELGLAVAPILRENLATLQAYRGEFEPAGAPGGQALIDTAITEISKRLESIVGPLEQSPASGPMEEPAAQEVAPQATGFPVVRPPFPPERADRKGEVLVVARTSSSSVPSIIEDVPAGLGSSVVDIVATATAALALKSNGRVEFWGQGLDPEEEEALESIGRIARIRMKERGEDLQVGLLLEDGTVEVVFGGRTRPKAEETNQIVSALENVVDIGITVHGGMALLADGTLVPWGNVRELQGALPSGAMGIRVSDSLVAALMDGGRILGMGGAGALGENVFCRDFQLGSQETWSALVWLPDGTVRASGAYSPFDQPVAALSRDIEVAGITAGHNAFGMVTEDSEWHLFGTKLDASVAAEKLEGCNRIAIGGDFIIGLRPGF